MLTRQIINEYPYKRLLQTALPLKYRWFVALRSVLCQSLWPIATDPIFVDLGTSVLMTDVWRIHGQACDRTLNGSATTPKNRSTSTKGELMVQESMICDELLVQMQQSSHEDDTLWFNSLSAKQQRLLVGSLYILHRTQTELFSWSQVWHLL
jgi:hypothetical protein